MPGMKYFYGQFDGEEFPTPDKLFGFDQLMEFIMQYGDQAMKARTAVRGPLSVKSPSMQLAESRGDWATRRLFTPSPLRLGPDRRLRTTDRGSRTADNGPRTTDFKV